MGLLHRVFGFLAFAAAVTTAAVPTSASAGSVLMISVDGLKPEYVLEADQRNLKIPYLRSLVAGGSYADGVVGVWPTVTYPSHTTLLTGVAPAVHGIFNNLEFDPQRHFSDAWFWYADQIRVPTLWQRAHAAHLRTASIGWPVSVGAADVDTLIPEFWRAFGSPEPNPSDRHLLDALARPAGLLADLQQRLGPYLIDNEIDLAGDAIKTRYAREILRARRPQFMTIHLSSLDSIQHAHGPSSAAANQTLEGIDALLDSLAREALASDPSTAVVVVSDHGFTRLTHRVNLCIPLIEAGLIDVQVDPETKAAKILGWKAQAWVAGGMAALMLHDSGDLQTLGKLTDLLQTLQKDPDNGIAAVLDRAEIARRGAFPDAALLVLLKPGYYAGGNLDGAFVTEIHGESGGHGFSPDYPEMRAAFFAAGDGIARHRDLGVVDMRQIAPTVAALLHVKMPSATAEPLHLGL